MLKNKYVVVILVIVAILAIGNTIRILTGENKKSVPVLKGPPVMEKSMKNVPRLMTSSNENEDTSEKQALKTPSVKMKQTENKVISFYKRLKDVRRDLLDPTKLIWGYDPFGTNEKFLSLKNERDIKFTDIFLSAIITKKEVRMCVINNIVFKEGEKKNGIYVSTIEDSNVILIANDREFKINIFERKSIPIVDKKNESGELR